MFYKVVPNKLFEFCPMCLRTPYPRCTSGHRRWGKSKEQKFFLQIYGKTVKQVERLLREYRTSDENYQVDGWMDFLRNKGVPYMEKYLAADFSFEF